MLTATSQLGPKGDARGRGCFGGAKIPRLEIGHQGLSTKIAFVMASYRPAQDPHQIVNLTSCVSPASI